MEKENITLKKSDYYRNRTGTAVFITACAVPGDY